MKYGIISFKNTRNLGDDIQTYAALKYLPKVDYVIEREELNLFVPDKNEIVTTIMSGWYLHDVTSLPPSPFINPLIISAHFTDHLLNDKPEYFDDYFLEYLKKYEPIGLRDDLVKKYLDDAEIENYFSGCLTLTIEPFKGVRKKNQICLVDVDEEIENKVRKTSPYDVILETHHLNYMEHSKLTFDERMKNVEDKLKKYQSCKMVITSRLHVALPCLSIGVPVLLIYNGSDLDVKNRLGKFIDLLNYMSKDDFIKKPNYNIENKKDFLKYRENLNSKVTEFIKKSEKIKLDKAEDYDCYYRYFVERKQSFDKMYTDKINEYERIINRLSIQNQVYEEESAIRAVNYVECRRNLELILASRSYKIALKIKRVADILRKVKKFIIRK